MTRHKGANSKGAINADDLKDRRRIERIMGSLNHASPQILPLMATTATVKACWAELSGASINAAWTYPADHVPIDGLAPGADRSGKPREKTYIR